MASAGSEASTLVAPPAVSTEGGGASARSAGAPPSACTADETARLLSAASPGTGREHYTLYPARWLVLAAFSLFSISNGWIWITWSPIEAQVAQLWGVTDMQVDSLSMVFLYIYPPLSFPALYLLNRIGMRNAMIIGSMLNLIGALLRWVFWERFTLVWVGTLLCASAQLFSIAVPPLVAGHWFGQNERALATGIGLMANQLGIAAGLGATIAVDMTKEGALPAYLFVQVCVASIAAVAVVFCVRDAPPTPASAGAVGVASAPPSYASSVKSVLCDRSGVALAVAYGLSVGALYAVSTLLSQLLPQLGPTDIGVLGLVLTLTGIVGAIGNGWVLDRWPEYKFVSCCTLGGALVTVAAFALAVDLKPTSAVVFVAMGAAGVFLTAFMSVCVEYANALAYPADEAAVAGVLTSTASVGGVFFVWFGGEMMKTAAGARSVNTMFVVASVLSLLIVVLGVNAGSRRRGDLDSK